MDQHSQPSPQQEGAAARPPRKASWLNNTPKDGRRHHLPGLSQHSTWAAPTPPRGADAPRRSARAKATLNGSSPCLSTKALHHTTPSEGPDPFLTSRAAVPAPEDQREHRGWGGGFPKVGSCCCCPPASPNLDFASLLQPLLRQRAWRRASGGGGLHHPTHQTAAKAAGRLSATPCRQPRHQARGRGRKAQPAAPTLRSPTVILW